MNIHDLSHEESMRLLGSVPVGRIIFTVRALPAVRPVNFIVDGGSIVIRTGLGSKFTAAVRNAVVAFQADAIDPIEHSGWSVTVTGRARTISDAAEKDRLRGVLEPWASGEKEHFMRIVPEVVTGVRLTPKSLMVPD